MNFVSCIRFAPHRTQAALLAPTVFPDCPDFFSFVADGEGDVMVTVHPAMIFAPALDRVREILGDDWVEADGDRLAIVEFHRDNQPELATESLKGQDLWSRQALHLGWRIWDVGVESDGPLGEVHLVEGSLRLSGFEPGHVISPILLVVPTEHTVRVRAMATTISLPARPIPNSQFFSDGVL